MLIEEEIVREEAYTLAESHKLDPERTFAVMSRIEEYRQETSDSEKSPYDRMWQPSLSCLDFDVALKHMQHDTALNLFETQDIKTIAREALFVSHLKHSDTPLYSLHELAELAGSFAEHLRNNRDSLLRTGYPDVPFQQSSYLSDRLSQLYFTRLPIGIDYSAIEEGRPGYIFAVPTGEEWKNIPRKARQIRCIVPLVAYLHNEYVYLETQDKYKVAAYEDVPDFYDLARADKGMLSVDDLDQLVAIREKLLDAKLNILLVLSSAARRRTAEGLWEKCLDIISSAFVAQDVEFMLRADEAYTGYGFVNNRLDKDTFTTLPPGGFTDIMMIIGHFEKELTIGTYADVYKRLSSVINSSLSAHDRLTMSSYFKMLSENKTQLVKDTYKVFRSKERQEVAFWNDYRDRVNDAIQMDFKEYYMPQTDPICIRRRDIPKFQMKWKPFCQALENNYEFMGDFPDVSVKIVTRKGVPETDHIFKQAGEKWWVKFDSKTVFLDDRHGMHCIRALLRKPYAPIDLSELLQILYPYFEPMRIHVRDCFHADIDISDSNTCQLGTACVDRDDYETVKNLRAWENETKDELEKAKLAGDESKVPELTEQYKTAKKIVSSLVNKYGKLRSEADAKKIIRDSISKNIKDSLAAMKNEHASLCEHLSIHIKLREGEYTYTPDCSIDWDIDA